MKHMKIFLLGIAFCSFGLIIQAEENREIRANTTIAATDSLIVTKKTGSIDRFKVDSTGTNGVATFGTDKVVVGANKFVVTTASGNTNVAGTLGVTGAATVGGTLDVTGATTLSGSTKAEGTLDVTGDTTITGRIAVAGSASTFTHTLTAGELVSGENLSVGKNASIAGTLDATGNTTLAGTLDVSGNVAVNKDKFAVTARSGDTSIAGTLGVTGAATVGGTLGVTGATTLSGATTVNNTLSVSGDTQLTGNVSVGSSEKSRSKNGTREAETTFVVNTPTQLLAGATIKPAAGASSTCLNVVGSGVVQNNLTVVGNTAVGSSLNVGDNALIGGHVEITGNQAYDEYGYPTKQASLIVHGDATVSGDISSNGYVKIYPSTKLNGEGEITKEAGLQVHGDTELGGNVTVASGGVTIDGSTVQTGISEDSMSDLSLRVSDKSLFQDTIYAASSSYYKDYLESKAKKESEIFENIKNNKTDSYSDLALVSLGNTYLVGKSRLFGDAYSYGDLYATNNFYVGNNYTGGELPNSITLPGRIINGEETTEPVETTVAQILFYSENGIGATLYIVGLITYEYETYIPVYAKINIVYTQTGYSGFVSNKEIWINNAPGNSELLQVSAGDDSILKITYTGDGILTGNLAYELHGNADLEEVEQTN